MPTPPVLTPALAAALLCGPGSLAQDDAQAPGPTDSAQAESMLGAGGEEETRPPLLAPRPARRVITEERIAAAIEDLAAEDWETREAASRLLESAPAAADALGNAAIDADPERRSRAVAALSEGVRQAALRGDVAATTAFVTALTDLQAGAEGPGMAAPAEDAPIAEPPAGNGGATVEANDDPAPDPAVVAEAAAAAKSALGLFPTSVTPLAIAEIRRRGAAVMRINQFDRGFGPALGGRNRLTWSITLDDRWTGGEEGLHHLRSIAGLNQVHLTDDCPIPKEARAGLIAGKYGDFSVERRGKAFLGVRFPPDGAGGCLIERVTAGGPASRAGLRAGDVIVKFGETPINTPASLLDAIREQGTLDEATAVTVQRPGQGEMVKSVTLGRWPDRPLGDPDEIAPQFPFRVQPAPRLVPPRPPFGGQLPPELREALPPDMLPPDEPAAEPADDDPIPPFGPDRPAERIPGNGDPADLGDTED